MRVNYALFSWKESGWEKQSSLTTRGKLGGEKKLKLDVGTGWVSICRQETLSVLEWKSCIDVGQKKEKAQEKGVDKWRGRSVERIG